jgi:hypothetical protein
MPHLFLLALLTSAKIILNKDVDNADDKVFVPAGVPLPSTVGMAGDRIVLTVRAKDRPKGNIRLPWPLLG